GRTLASCSNDGTVKLWDATRRRAPALLHGRGRELLTVTYSPDGRLLACGSYDGLVKVWDSATAGEVITFNNPEAPVRCIDFSPDSKLLAWGSDDRSVRVGDLRSGRLTAVLPGHPWGVGQLA